MDANALLRSMGWKEGQGLGKSNQGISQAIKPKVQLDRNGLGLNPAASLIEPWWAKVFNQTAKNVSVGEGTDGKTAAKKRVCDKVHTEKRTDPTERIKKKRKKKTSSLEELTRTDSCGPTESSSVNAHIASISKSLYLGSFTKGSTLRSGESLTGVDEVESALENKGGTVSDEPHLNPIDDDLWKSCDGRTAHKGARYGVLKGKMARLVRQEQAMLTRHCDTNR